MSHARHVLEIRDRDTGAVARILTSLGFNCFSFEAAFGDERIEVIWAEAGFERGGRRVSGSGIPLLFPFPGRIAGGTFTFRGRAFAIEPSDGRGHAIHGFAHTRPWRVLDHERNRIVGEFHASVDDPRLLAYWPADFRIRAEYALHGNRLNGVYSIDNPSDQPLPVGFGTHPYFRVPLGGEDGAECVVTLPVSEEYELDDLVPTGLRFRLRDADAFHEGIPFGEMQFDNVFGGLVFAEDGWCRTTISDPSSRRRVAMTFDRPFTTCVVYTPGHREAVCIEPLTCVPNAVRLDAAGIPSGLRVLEPGESLVARVDIAVS